MKLCPSRHKNSAKNCERSTFRWAALQTFLLNPVLKLQEHLIPKRNMTPPSPPPPPTSVDDPDKN